MKIDRNVSLAPYSTLRVGGPAEYFGEAKSKADLIEAAAFASEKKIKLTVLGNLSNTLISDEGVKGLVIKNSADKIDILDSYSRSEPAPAIKPRFNLVQPDPKLKELAYAESKYEAVGVRLESGAYIPRAIFQLIAQGITGLEWFAGIPATVGGASYINIHGADKYWSDYLVGAEILGADGKEKAVGVDYFRYGYDDSSLKRSQDIVLSVTLELRRGPKDQALAIAKYWQQHKSHQPQRSLGCIFQNLSEAEQKRLKLPTPSIGYIIDKKLGLKGTVSGQAAIAQKHAGFIENLGGAKASDVKKLIDMIKAKAKADLGLELKLEIVVL
jgi:UDP-N-acetylmuramate dehydrogenase